LRAQHVLDNRPGQIINADTAVPQIDRHALFAAFGFSLDPIAVSSAAESTARAPPQACSTARRMMAVINFSRFVSPCTACDTFSTAERSKCSTGVSTVRVGSESRCSSAR
jgi:hypothetical protein